MREAIANANVFNLVIVFVVVLLGFFVGSLSYSKAYKVKNLIVNEIEKEEEWNDKVKERVEKSLSNIGYRVKSSTSNRVDCGKVRQSKGDTVINTSSNYEYCVYAVNEKTDTKVSTYYRVVAYMYFDVPIINSLTKVPVVGETKDFSTLNS